MIDYPQRIPDLEKQIFRATWAREKALNERDQAAAEAAESLRAGAAAELARIRDELAGTFSQVEDIQQRAMLRLRYLYGYSVDTIAAAKLGLGRK